jgi:hypothetical protein
VNQSLQLITAISRGQRAAARAASGVGSPVSPGPSSTTSSRKAARRKLTVSTGAGAGAKPVIANGSSSTSSSSAAGDVVQVGPGTWKLVGYTQDLNGEQWAWAHQGTWKNAAVCL